MAGRNSSSNPDVFSVPSDRPPGEYFGSASGYFTSDNTSGTIFAPQLAPIPEPSMVFLFLAGFLVIMAFTRRMEIQVTAFDTKQNIATAVFVKTGVDVVCWIGRSAHILFP